MEKIKERYIVTINKIKRNILKTNVKLVDVFDLSDEIKKVSKELKLEQMSWGWSNCQEYLWTISWKKISYFQYTVNNTKKTCLISLDKLITTNWIKYKDDLDENLFYDITNLLDTDYQIKYIWVVTFIKFVLSIKEKYIKEDQNLIIHIVPTSIAYELKFYPRLLDLLKENKIITDFKDDLYEYTVFI